MKNWRKKLMTLSHILACAAAVQLVSPRLNTRTSNKYMQSEQILKKKKIKLITLHQNKSIIANVNITILV